MGDTNPGSGKQPRKRLTPFGRAGAVAGAIARILKEPDRPAIFDVLFWSILALIYAFLVFAPEIPVKEVGLAPMTAVCIALVAVWLALPWRLSASRRRKLLAPVFLVAATATLFASDLIWAAGLYPIAFANAVFVFGPRRGAAYSAAVLLALFGTAFFRAIVDNTGSSPEDVVQMFAFIALLTVICLGLSSAVIEARRSRERAENLLDDLESAHAELRRYARRVRELTLSEERARIAGEMHDSVGHHLTAVKLQAEAAVKMAEKRPERAREQMERARDLAAEAFEEVHRSVRALRSPTAGERSGSGALGALVRSFEGTGFGISFDVEGEEKALPEETELALYRTLQESLTNAARHSGAHRVRVRMLYGDEVVKLTVADDGRGASEEARTTGGGFGLPALEQRVEALGGVFTAENLPEGGFVVEIELPFGKPSVKPPAGGTPTEAP